MDDYVVTSEYGCTVVRGLVPIDDMTRLAADCDDPDLVMDMELSSALDATLVFGTRKACQKAREQLKLSLLPPSERTDWPLQEQVMSWRRCGSTGASSKAMASVALASVRGEPPSGRIDHPRDADDFRRCALMLEWAPAVRNHMEEVKTLSVQWACLIDEWSTLEGLLGDEWKSAQWQGAPELNRRIREILSTSEA